MISDDNRIFKIFKNFFSIAVSDLKIPSQCNYFNKKTHSLPTILKTFEKHSSVLNIKKGILSQFFSFRKYTQEEVTKVIRDLNTKKKVVRRVALPNRVPVFSQISFIKILTTSLIKVNFSMI